MTPSWAAYRCWLGPCPHDPLRCGLSSSLSHTDALRNFSQFAKIPQGRSTVLPCYCIAWHSHVLPWNSGATSLLVAGATVGWVGALYLSRSRHFLEVFRRDAVPHSLRCSRPTLKPHSVGRTPGGLVVFHWLRPSVDGPSWTQWGSMPVLVRGLAP